MNSNDIADYLIDNPQFFEEHAELLSKIKLTSPLLGRAISLQERQMEVVRDKHRQLELRLSELLRVAHDNDAISHKYQQWTRSLLQARNDVELPYVLTQGLQELFALPHSTLRLWNVSDEYSHAWFAKDATDDIKLFSAGLKVPFCGKNHEFEAVDWIESKETILSVAMLPLRLSADEETFGLLVMGSPDPARFTKDMATNFLVNIANTSSAALSGLINL